MSIFDRIDRFFNEPIEAPSSAPPPTAAATEVPPQEEALDDALLPKLGDRVEDRITGYTGIVTFVATFLNGCARVGVTSEKLNAEGKPLGEESFDMAQVRVIKQRVHAPRMAQSVEVLAVEQWVDGVTPTSAPVVEKAQASIPQPPPGGPERNNAAITHIDVRRFMKLK